MREQIAELQKLRAELRTKELAIENNIKKYVTNKNIPLEERWDAFIDSGLGEEEDYVVRFTTLDNDLIGYSRDIDIDRHETINVIRIVSEIEDARAEMEDDPEDDYNRPELAKVDIDAFKEEVLSRFIYSFTFDW